MPSIVILDQNPDVAKFFGSMIALDDPLHFRLRSIVQNAFTPKMVAQVEEPARSSDPMVRTNSLQIPNREV